jgi:hypothetical protein
MRKWLHGLLASVIGAFANAVLTLCGVGGSNAVLGTDIKLDLTQLLVQCAMAGLVGAAMYLKQSPLPSPDSDF